MFEAIGKALRPNTILPLLPLPGEHLLEAIGLGGAKRFAAVILGGGTLINRFYLGLAKRALSWNVPLCVAGTGVGSPGFGFSSDHAEDLRNWADVLSRSPLVGVRGPESERLLREAGLANVEIIGDPALAYTPDVIPPIRSRPRLAINLGPERNAPAGGVAAVVGEFAKSGGELVGVSLGPGDELCLRDFRTRYDLRQMTIESHRRSGEQLLATLAGSHALISVRLHGAVIATCAGVPSVLFSYRSKCLDFMSSVNLQTFAVPVSAAGDGPLLRDRLREIAAKPQLRKAIHETALAWRQKQQNFFARIHQLIEKAKKY